MIIYECDFCKNQVNEYKGTDMYRLVQVHSTYSEDEFEDNIICKNCLKKLFELKGHNNEVDN